VHREARLAAEREEYLRQQRKLENRDPEKG
jgi:hypothetical protein